MPSISFIFKKMKTGAKYGGATGATAGTLGSPAAVPVLGPLAPFVGAAVGGAAGAIGGGIVGGVSGTVGYAIDSHTRDELGLARIQAADQKLALFSDTEMDTLRRNIMTTYKASSNTFLGIKSSFFTRSSHTSSELMKELNNPAYNADQVASLLHTYLKFGDVTNDKYTHNGKKLYKIIVEQIENANPQSATPIRQIFGLTHQVANMANMDTGPSLGNTIHTAGMAHHMGIN